MFMFLMRVRRPVEQLLSLNCKYVDEGKIKKMCGNVADVV